MNPCGALPLYDGDGHAPSPVAEDLWVADAEIRRHVYGRSPSLTHGVLRRVGAEAGIDVGDRGEVTDGVEVVALLDPESISAHPRSVTP